MGLFKRNKNTNKPVIRQILDLIPMWILSQSTNTYRSDKWCSAYKTYDQLVSQIYGQLYKCHTLSDISAGIGISKTFISDLGLKQSPARSTMSDGNAKRDWHVFESLYYKLLSHYRSLLKKHHKSFVLKDIENRSVKLIDSSTISLCLAMFDWAKFRTAKGGVKLHTSLDLEVMLPDIVNITEAKVHDRNGLEHLVFPKDTIIVEDRGYFDFSLMASRALADNVFVTRIKSNTVYETLKEQKLPEGKDTYIVKDEIIRLTSDKARKSGISKHKLRLVHVYKEDEDKIIVIVTNQLEWDALTIAELYKKRWDIELFFKALKQNLQVKTFLGTSENALKSQIYIALTTFLLLELIRRTVVKKDVAFTNFVEKIRMSLCFYLTLDYVCNTMGEGAKKAKPPDSSRNKEKQDLFSQNKQLTLFK